ncbi:DUF6064 family protein [Roseospira goensis]|uniref:MFS transporter permease n=1 Tax=Roseospira goensis TaxID=391922 RepID=A0A7W6S3A2_9PROT|nr:DUF6064 family protein [Roseospira goensis]MBB4287590.1 hypothetical protein [Roseospira goensis]
MDAVLSYNLTDLVPFGPETYHRLFARLNAALWPGPLLLPLVGAGLVVLAWRAPRGAGRVTAGALGLAWLWVGWDVLLGRFGPLLWAAPYAAALVWIQGAAMLLAGALAGATPARRGPSVGHGLGLLLALAGVVAWPLSAPLSGRPWIQAEVVGLAPDPTALLTLGLLLMAGGRVRWGLMVIPVVWLALSTAVHVAMAQV